MNQNVNLCPLSLVAARLALHPLSSPHAPTAHPGVLDAKVGYFDPKSAKVHPVQIGTKPAKVGHLAANPLKYLPEYKATKNGPFYKCCRALCNGKSKG